MLETADSSGDMLGMPVPLPASASRDTLVPMTPSSPGAKTQIFLVRAIDYDALVQEKRKVHARRWP